VPQKAKKTSGSRFFSEESRQGSHRVHRQLGLLSKPNRIRRVFIAYQKTRQITSGKSDAENYATSGYGKRVVAHKIKNG